MSPGGVADGTELEAGDALGGSGEGSLGGSGSAVSGGGAAAAGSGPSMTEFWHWLRLRALWFLVPPFLFLARPTTETLLVGGALALAGCALRSWAAGHIRKAETLAVTGPYAYVRHPLYVGSLILGLGVTIAASRLSFYIFFAAYFVVVYTRTVKCEDETLEECFGEAFRRYRGRVRALLPRLSPYRPAEPAVEAGRRFSLRRWLRNREYEAVMGTLAGIGVLALKMALF